MVFISRITIMYYRSRLNLSLAIQHEGLTLPRFCLFSALQMFHSSTRLYQSANNKHHTVLSERFAGLKPYLANISNHISSLNVR